VREVYNTIVTDVDITGQGEVESIIYTSMRILFFFAYGVSKTKYNGLGRILFSSVGPTITHNS